MHIISGSKQLAKWRYMIRHNLIATRVHWELCRKHEIEATKNQCEHVPFPYMVTQTGIEIHWDVEIKTIKWCRGAVLITIAQLHSTKPELRLCTGSRHAHGVSEIGNGEEL